jgi:thiamine-monophosphate kinase
VEAVAYNRLVKVSEIGEFGLIRLLADEFHIPYPPRKGHTSAGLLVPLGDDAVVTPGTDRAAIWTTDTLVAGNHFLPERTSWRDAGWKALAVNVSDIAAMGGEPHLALVTLSLPEDFFVDDAVELYRGLHDAAKTYGVTLGGGDVVRSPVFSITVALSGLALTSESGKPMLLRRDAAVAGDVVAVTGNLGAAAAGVQLLVQGPDFDAIGQPDAEQRLRRAQQHPIPRLDVAQAAVKAGLRCAIDVSDGLVQDLGHIATASEVAVVVESQRVPVDPDVRAVFPDLALGLALGGGEDYELILVGPEASLNALAIGSETPLTIVGRVEDGAPGVRVVGETGAEIPTRPGWDHFATP